MDWTLFLLPYGETWRQLRTYFHKYLNQTVVQEYRDIQMKHTKVLLKLLYQSPERFRSHLRFVVGAAILEITYGYQASSDKDPFILFSENAITELTRVGVPGTYLVDVIPILKHIPPWFPGARFRRELERLRGLVEEMVDKPIQYVKHALRGGKAIPCITASLFEQFENDPDRPADYEDTIKKFAGTMYMTGIDTTDGYLLHLVRALLLHPHAQRRAQEELDEVVGSGALPSFDNFAKLRYIQAIVYEVLRWNTPVPAAIPHRLKENDVVNGYFIPKGTLVFGTSWTLLRSESVYGTDASKFNPERFLDENVTIPDFGFGYGRRACPGRHFAEGTAFLITACILHLFHILPVIGDNGSELPGEEDCDSGVILRPKDFKCRFVPRSSAAVHILEGLDF